MLSAKVKPLRGNRLTVFNVNVVAIWTVALVFGKIIFTDQILHAARLLSGIEFIHQYLTVDDFQQSLAADVVDDLLLLGNVGNSYQNDDGNHRENKNHFQYSKSLFHKLIILQEL